VARLRPPWDRGCVDFRFPGAPQSGIVSGAMANVWIALMQVCPTGEAPELTASGGLILLVGGGLLAGFVFYETGEAALPAATWKASRCRSSSFAKSRLFYGAPARPYL
jgi:hypothetical protein